MAFRWQRAGRYAAVRALCANCRCENVLHSLEGPANGLLGVAITGNNRREWVWYVADAEAFATRVRDLLSTSGRRFPLEICASTAVANEQPLAHVRENNGMQLTSGGFERASRAVSINAPLAADLGVGRALAMRAAEALLSTFLGATVVGTLGCGQEARTARVADPDPVSLVSRWVRLGGRSTFAAARALLTGATPPASLSLELKADQSCVAGRDMLAFMGRCNGQTSATSGQVTCKWAVEKAMPDSEVLVLATGDAAASPFLWLRLGVARDTEDGALSLFGACRDGQEYVFVRAQSD